MKKDKKTIMYNLLLITALVLIPQKGFCDEKEESITRKDMQLKGPVVVVVEKDCKFERAFGEIKRTSSKDSRKIFYSNGNLAKRVYSPTEFKKYDYDKYGNLTCTMTIEYGNNDHCDTTSINKYEYEYNSKGKMIRKKDLGLEVKILGNSRAKEFIYEYNSNGNISETKVFDIFDNSKTQTERIAYSYNNGVKKISTYGEKGLQKEEIFNGLNHIIRENKGFYWDVKTIKLDNNKRPIRIDNTLESMFNGKKEKLLSVVLNYDSKGNLIKTSQYKYGESKPFLVLSSQYTYDSYGNWIKNLSFINNNLTSWEEREFIYAKNENDYKKYNQDDLSIFFKRRNI